ncbi:Hsp20/alpha crystallin family protein [Allosalinactinospora lopnorensis]|uniref:Hsp20/alpha crystallin family protein n=1 Tax=Allosalinactinospora lopnorensis TaxID=1352348 RepID=UPI000623DDDD|nr:Hsp20/alpha crystallin family protein [Allosalinactinospora lopnorensis]
MAELSRRGTLFPDLSDWFDMPFFSERPGMYRIRVEDFEEDGRYVVRAEMPGIDPEKDVDITVASGRLTIRGERREGSKEKHRSEFRYGSFVRTVTLPEGVDESDVQATYNNGILEVSVPIPTKEKEKKERRIPVQRGK